MIKKIVSSLLVATLVFSGSSAYASPNEKAEVPSKVSQTNNKNLYTVDGDLLGSLNKTTTIEQLTDKDGKPSYILTEVKDYQLSEKYATIPAYREKFADSTESTIYSFNKNNELLVNGEVVSENDFPIMSRAQETGGVTEISHYYSTSDMLSYSFRTYEDIVFEFDHGVQVSPSGNHVAKVGITRSNLYFHDAKASMDSLETNLRDFDVAAAAFALAANLAFYTIGTLGGAIFNGGAAAIAAITAYNLWGDCNDDVADAYTYVSMM